MSLAIPAVGSSRRTAIWSVWRPVGAEAGCRPVAQVRRPWPSSANGAFHSSAGCGARRRSSSSPAGNRPLRRADNRLRPQTRSFRPRRSREYSRPLCRRSSSPRTPTSTWSHWIVGSASWKIVRRRNADKKASRAPPARRGQRARRGRKVHRGFLEFPDPPDRSDKRVCRVRKVCRAFRAKEDCRVRPVSQARKGQRASAACREPPG